jgi:hypothetical protein
LHFVDVEREEAGGLLAVVSLKAHPPSSVRIETVLMLKLVSTSPVERLLA